LAQNFWGPEDNQSELERILRQTFPKIKAKLPTHPSKQPKFEIGDFDSGINLQQTSNATPGLTYQGGPQHTSNQQGGGAQAQQAAQAELDTSLQGKDPNACPPWLNKACLDILSRMLETTFRNFQQTARRPSHIDPPFRALPICVPNEEITLPGIPYGGPLGSFVQVSCFQVPAQMFRAEVQSMAQALETTAAFGDVEWQVTVDGVPYHPWEQIYTQLWDWPITPLCSPIHLVSNQTICLNARSLSTLTHLATARICGYYYPVRSEAGDGSVRSTIVD